MPYKDPAKNKEWSIKNREKLALKKKEYYYKNREKILESYKTPKGRKTKRISDWKGQGILCFDWLLLYDIFLSTKNCEYCNCELTEGTSSSGRCLDHDHSITDRFNIRGVLCTSCNKKDVLK